MEKIKKTKIVEYDAYVTSDGQEFESSILAQWHEEELKQKKREQEAPRKFSVRIAPDLEDDEVEYDVVLETGNWMEAKKGYEIRVKDLITISGLHCYIKNTITGRNFRDGEWRMSDWPKNERGHFVCTKDKPMGLELAKEGRWEHDDVHETDYDGDYSIEWKCESCGHVWRTEMPD